jgi:hypothetical protein
VPTPKCSAHDCDQLATTTVDQQPVCLAHFVADCQEKLHKLGQSNHTWSVGGPAWESARSFVKECVQSAARLTQLESGISNLERAQLVDIALWAAELGQKLRRSPRSPVAIPIRLKSEQPGHVWEEETYTLDLSRHGARTKCENVVETDGVLEVIRLDTNEHLEARVVWRRISSGIQEIGLEFLSGAARAKP